MKEEEFGNGLIKKREDDANKDKATANIIDVDQLMFIEAVLSDDVKVLYRSSQDLTNRAQLDNRKSVMSVIYFYEKVTEVFNI